ncbi:hypothetical protein WDZ92_24915, partial [Nostoc sp. NIES-2111]
MGARTKPARHARRAVGAGAGQQGKAQAKRGEAAGNGTDRHRPVPLTREEVLRSLAWTAPASPDPEHGAGAREPAPVAEGPQDMPTERNACGERVVCPPIAAGFMAEEVLASLDPRRFRDMLLELADALQPVTSPDWLDLLSLVRNQLDGHDVAVARSRILAQARVSQRAELLRGLGTAKKLDLDSDGVQAVA